jgi:hypothetical protein
MLTHPLCKLLQQIHLVIVFKRSILQHRKHPAAHTQRGSQSSARQYEKQAPSTRQCTMAPAVAAA